MLPLILAAIALAAEVITVKMFIFTVASIAFGEALGHNARKKARRQAAQARSDYNASLADRSVTALTAAPPYRVVYGRAITGGDVVAIFTSDKSWYKPDGTAYTKPDALKHLVVHFASHEVQAINDIQIDGVSLGHLDGNGNPVSGEFKRTEYTSQQRSFTTSVTVGQPVVSVINAYVKEGWGDNYMQYDVMGSITLTNGNLTINSSDPRTVYVEYTIDISYSSVRVQKHLGTDAQTVDAYLNSLFPSGTPNWDSSHRLRGLAYCVITLDLEDARFQGGPPNITADIIGKKVYDPRLGYAIASDNVALCTRDFLLGAYGYEAVSADVDDTAVTTAANACDVRNLAAVHNHAGTFTADTTYDTLVFSSDMWFSTGDGVRLTTSGTLPSPLSAGVTYYVIPLFGARTFKLATSIANAQAGTAINITSVGSGTHTCTWYDYATFTCNGAFTTDEARESTLENLVNTMAGYAINTGQWRIMAGAWTASVMDIGDDDLAGAIECPQTDLSFEDLFNSVRGVYVPAGTSTPVEFEPYSDATYRTADNNVYLWDDLTLHFVNNKARCKNLARIHLERSRNGQRLLIPAKLKAWPLQPGDRIRVSSTEYGLTLKYYRLTDWNFSQAGAVLLSVVEDDAGAYDLAPAVSADPTPNTGLPNPWAVSHVTGTTFSTSLVKQSDGTFKPRIKVTWDAITDPYVVDPAGRVVVLWSRFHALGYERVETTGDAISLSFDGPREGDILTVEIYARNSLGQTGRSTFLSYTVPITQPTYANQELVLVAHGDGSGVAQVRGNNVQKVAGGAAWNAGAYSKTAYLGGCVAGWTSPENANSRIMAGLNDDPATNAGYSGLTWALYLDVGGTVYVYNNGSSLGAISTWSPGDGALWEVIYTGVLIQFKKNGALLAIGGPDGYAVAMNLSFAFDCSIESADGDIHNITFKALTPKPKNFTAVSYGYSGTGGPAATGFFDNEWDADTPLYSAVRSYNMARIARSTGLITFQQTYDVYGNGATTAGRNAATLATDLNNTTSDSIVVVWCHDEPRNLRLTSGLDVAMRRCGASRQVFENVNFKANSAYILVGRGGCGEGNGIEQYRGAVDGDTNAWCSVNFFLTQQGEVNTTGTQTTRDPVESFTAFNAVSHGASTMRMVGNSIWKDQGLGASAAWDAGIYSTFGITGTCYAQAIASQASGQLMFALNTDPATNASYETLDYAIYLSGTNVYVYRNGTATAALTTYNAGDVFRIEYTGRAVVYTKNGVVFFHHGATPGQTLYFDSSFYDPGNKLQGVEFGTTNVPAKSGNMLDASSWAPGTAGNQGASNGSIGGYLVGESYFGYTASSTDNSVMWSLGPDGNYRWVWEGKGAGAGGGGGGFLTGTVPIDPTKLYRFSCWIKNSVVSGTPGSDYLGTIQDNSVAVLTTGTPSGNPYFAVAARDAVTLVPGRWYLFVGFVFPHNHGTTAPSPGMGGIYDGVTGELVQGPYEYYKWVSTAVQAYLRTFLYYADTNQRTTFFDPRIDLCDGTEPNLDALLAVGKPSRVGNVPVLFGESLGLNGQFTSWAAGSAYPTNWTVWSNPGGTISRETSIVRTGPNALRMSNSGTNETGAQWSVSFASSPMEVGAYIEVEFDAYVVTNTSGGVPGVYAVAWTNAGLTTYETVFIPIDDTNTGVWQTRKANLSPPPGGRFYGILLYAMASWASAPGGKWVGDVIFDSIIVNAKMPKNTGQLVQGAVSLTHQETASNSSLTVTTSAPYYGVEAQDKTILTFTRVTPDSIMDLSINGRFSVLLYSAANGGFNGPAAGEYEVSYWCEVNLYRGTTFVERIGYVDVVQNEWCDVDDTKSVHFGVTRSIYVAAYGNTEFNVKLKNITIKVRQTQNNGHAEIRAIYSGGAYWDTSFSERRV